MLVALGAQITLQEFVAGRTTTRLRKACTWLEGWCAKAEGGLCSPASLIFLATSWAEARKVDGNSDWLSFLSGKAFANRLAFHAQLVELLNAQEEGDGLAYLAQLYALSSRLRRPCLRLRILQQILGLDSRFSRDIVHGVICLAFDVLEGMGIEGTPIGTPIGTSPSPPALRETVPNPAIEGNSRGSVEGRSQHEPAVSQRGRSDKRPGIRTDTSAGSLMIATDPVGAGDDACSLALDGFDEATRLEAEAVLGGVRSERPSDPLGEASRKMRVQYYYR